MAEWVAATGAAVFTFGLGTRMMRGPFEASAPRHRAACGLSPMKTSSTPRGISECLHGKT